MLLALCDLDEHTLTIANAGHLDPLLMADGECSPIATLLGAPVGVTTPAGYRQRVLHLPEGATFLAFTDGLVERRGELIDESLASLACIVGAESGSLTELLDNVLARTAGGDADDDTAILGVRWLSKGHAASPPA